MKSKSLLICCLILTSCTSFETAKPKSLHIQDAQNFAKLLENDNIPSEEVLQKEYLDKGGLGVEIFTPYRIENAKNLHDNLVANIAKYRHAAQTCLPVVMGMENKTDKILRKIADLLGEKESALAFILFGANNSGGTANAKGLALGLEIVCDGKTKENAAQQIEALIAHEMVHVYQNRGFTDDIKVDLLFSAIMEGGADFIADLALGRKQSMDSEFGKYGMAHEAEIWREFKADYDAGIYDGNDWFYSKGRNGRPNDLGYFIGRRICEAYYENAKDKQAALKTLIAIKDPKKILEESGYGKF